MSTATWPLSLPTIARLAAPLAAAVLAAACAQSAPAGLARLRIPVEIKK